METLKAPLPNVAGKGTTVVSFHEGLVGLPHVTRFELEAPEEIDPLLRLRGLDVSGLSFLVVDPRLVVADYRPAFPEAAMDSLGLSESSPRVVLVIVSVSPALEECSVNLLAPILIDPASMRGLQVVLEPGSHAARHPLLPSAS